MRKLAIIGAGGHGKVIADIAEKNGYTEILFLDDDETVRGCGGYPVAGKSSDAFGLDADVIIGIGNAGIRKRVQESLDEADIATLIHPDAIVAGDAVVGAGSVVMAGSVINPGAEIGRGCIINTCSSVDHDCKVDDYVHVSVGSHLCGGVTVGEGTWIGAGATVSNHVSICQECVIGAGTVVIRDIEESGTYVGVPARKIDTEAAYHTTEKSGRGVIGQSGGVFQQINPHAPVNGRTATQESSAYQNGCRLFGSGTFKVTESTILPACAA